MAEFETSFRGYDPEDVERVLFRLRNELETLRQSSALLEERAAELRSEVTTLAGREEELNRRVSTSPDKPSYRNLGSQFEEALRVGEERAERMVAEGRAEASLTRQTAEAKASRRIREAEETAQVLLADTNARIDELRLTSETKSAELITQANTKLAELAELASTARRQAATNIAEGERKIAEDRSALLRDLELQRSNMQDMIEATSREISIASEEMRNREEQFERENMRYHQEAAENANRMINEANERVADVTRRASEVAQETDVLLRNARIRADEIINDARLMAVGMVEQSSMRATDLTAKTRHHIDLLLDRLVTRTERLKEEREYLDSYVERVNDVRTAEMIVSEFEEEMHISGEMAKSFDAVEVEVAASTEPAAADADEPTDQNESE